LADRLLLSEAVEAVGKLMSAWPNSKDVANSYIGALASVLITYPRTVAMRCSDPILGVARETKFLPTVADLVAWCERETAAMRKPVEIEDRDARILREMQDRRGECEYWQKARAKRPSLDDLRAKHGPNWGIGNSDTEGKLAAKERNLAAVQAANERAWSQREGVTSAGIVITDALRSVIQNKGAA
jgi:hypothetical protein